MKIALTPAMAKFVAKKIKAGQYASAEDVVGDALTRLQTEDELPKEDLDELRRLVSVGIEQAERGEYANFTAETVIRDGRKLLANRRKTR
jgi:antitoxin ParD1/3/4